MNTRSILVIAALLLVGACSTFDDAPDAAGTGDSPTSLDGDAAIASSELDPNAALIPGSQDDLEVNVGDRVFFATDSSSIDEAARQTLERQAAWLLDFPGVIITIEGHADERGSSEYNLALGNRRAVAVKNYLAALGVSPDRILTISYGKERPADPGRSETAWALNRRAVTVVSVTN